MMAYVISADELKKTLAGYSPEKAEDFHEASAKLADKAFTQALKERPEARIILMSGGTASGKSEYVSVYLQDESAIVLDGTLPTLKGAEIKIRNAEKASKSVEIHSVMPADMRVAFAAFLNRDRKFPVEHFYRTHSRSRSTLLELMRNFPEIIVKLVVSTGEPASGMTFTEQQFTDRQQTIEFIASHQLSEEAIRNQIYYDN